MLVCATRVLGVVDEVDLLGSVDGSFLDMVVSLAELCKVGVSSSFAVFLSREEVRTGSQRIGTESDRCSRIWRRAFVFATRDNP